VQSSAVWRGAARRGAERRARDPDPSGGARRASGEGSLAVDGGESRRGDGGSAAAQEHRSAVKRGVSQ